MSVAAIHKSGFVTCQWQDADGRPYQQDYPPEGLQLWSDYEAQKKEDRERFARTAPTHAVTSSNRYRRGR
jgi:hypothetical protein